MPRLDTNHRAKLPDSPQPWGSVRDRLPVTISHNKIGRVLLGGLRRGDFGESFFGLLRLVAAARIRLPRKNPGADVCRDQSSPTLSESHNADIRACTGAPRHKPNSMERAPKNCKDYYDRQALPALRRSPLRL